MGESSCCYLFCVFVGGLALSAWSSFALVTAVLFVRIDCSCALLGTVLFVDPVAQLSGGSGPRSRLPLRPWGLGRILLGLYHLFVFRNLSHG